MSRSYKRYPVHVKKDKASKKIHNRKVRRTFDVANGSKHKRITERYDIYDWRFRPLARIDEMDWNEKKLYTKK